ncbi:MAG: type III secretion system effector protein [Bacteroidales bacterium]|jgi:hypothetical protein|nr:type III secretion system effector protein [Bacteroidales bacterium]
MYPIGSYQLSKETVLYQNGVLYNKDGSVSEYQGNQKGLLKHAVGALDKVGSGSAEGRNILSELQGSDNNFILQKGSKNSYTPFSTVNAGANLSEYQNATGNILGSNGSGGNIFWNPNSKSGGVNLSGGTSCPPYIGLIHEMGHASDSNQGLLHFGNDYTNVTTGATYQYMHNGVAKREWRAVYRENIVRDQMGIPLRTHYGVDQSSSPSLPIGTRLLDANNLPINYR